jgi:hypothetical protein
MDDTEKAQLKMESAEINPKKYHGAKKKIFRCNI